MVFIPRSLPVRSMLLFLVCGLWLKTASSAEVQYPLSIAVTDTGVIYLADRNLPGVWQLESGKLTAFFEGSKKFRTPLNAIRCVAIDRDGKVWAGDSATRDVYRLDGPSQAVGITQNQKTSAAISSDEVQKEKEPANSNDADKKTSGEKPAEPTKTTEGPPSAAKRPPFIHGQIGIPMDLAFNKNGDLFVSDLEIHRIVKVAKDSPEVTEFVQLQAPRGLCFDDQDNLWAVSGRRLVKVSPKGEKTTVVDNGTFEYPHTVAVAPDQTAYVCDGYAKAIWKIPAGGKPEKFVSGEPLVNPVGMRLAKDKLYIVDPRAKAVFEIGLDKKITTVPLKVAAP